MQTKCINFSRTVWRTFCGTFISYILLINLTDLHFALLCRICLMGYKFSVSLFPNGSENPVHYNKGLEGFSFNDCEWRKEEGETKQQQQQQSQQLPKPNLLPSFLQVLPKRRSWYFRKAKMGSSSLGSRRKRRRRRRNSTQPLPPFFALCCCCCCCCCCCAAVTVRSFTSVNRQSHTEMKFCRYYLHCSLQYWCIKMILVIITGQVNVTGPGKSCYSLQIY